ncbi:PAS domain S-box protein [bacterium]|nr:PAS domain S-box protein [bacterium]
MLHVFGLKRKQKQSVLPYEELFSLISESVDEVLWCARLDVDRVIYVSPAFEKVWGIPREELYADSSAWINAIIPEDRERVRESYGAWIQGNAPQFRSEFRIRRRTDGEILWISDRSGIRKKYDGFTLVGGIAEDMTERRKLEEERNELLSRLQGALKVRDEFVSFASHELKTPLVPLRLSLATLLSVLDSKEKVELQMSHQPGRDSGLSATRLVRVALDQLRRMEVLTNNLLDATQLQSGNFRIRQYFFGCRHFSVNVWCFRWANCPPCVQKGRGMH